MDIEIDWNAIIKKEARGIDDLDLGEVQEVVGDKVVVQKGIIDHNIFHLPKTLVQNFDGQVLHFNISEVELKNCEVESPAPSVREQYLSTTDINSGGGSSGGIQIESDTANRNDDPLL
ncbi:hypothetical protein [Candidatus Nitrosocosmicus sp. T]